MERLKLYDIFQLPKNKPHRFHILLLSTNYHGLYDRFTSHQDQPESIVYGKKKTSLSSSSLSLYSDPCEEDNLGRPSRRSFGVTIQGLDEELLQDGDEGGAWSAGGARASPHMLTLALDCR